MSTWSRSTVNKTTKSINKASTFMDGLSLTEYVNSRCGEIYLSKEGTLIFLCSLCNGSFNGYGNYLAHILSEHDLPVYSVEEVEGTDQSKGYDAIEYDNETCSQTEMLGNAYEMISSDYEKDLEELDFRDSAEIDVDTNSYDTNFENEIESESLNDNEKTTEEYLEAADEQHANDDENGTNIKRRRRRKSSAYPSQGLFECPVCQLCIKGKSNLEKHILRHDDDNKRFHCNYCPKRFHVKFELKQHESSHTGEKPYLCTTCGRRFVSTGKLNEHVNMIHENIRNKSCEICNKKFYSNKYLRRHMMTHTNERSHKCEICGTAFKVRKTLQAHMKLHENKREYQCEYCDAQFNQRPALHSHVKSRHKDMLPTSTRGEDEDEVEFEFENDHILS